MPASTPNRTKPAPHWRWLAIVLRTLHLVGVVMTGAALAGRAGPAMPGIALMFASGAALFAVDVWRHPPLWREVAGLCVGLKLLAVASMALLPSAAQGLFWLLVVVSSLVSHAPHEFRHRLLLPARSVPR